ncbi:MAG: hypothetical protein AAF203_00635 [Pseudomonadota bacterium]
MASQCVQAQYDEIKDLRVYSAKLGERNASFKIRMEIFAHSNAQGETLASVEPVEVTELLDDKSGEGSSLILTLREDGVCEINPASEVKKAYDGPLVGQSCVERVPTLLDEQMDRLLREQREEIDELSRTFDRASELGGPNATRLHLIIVQILEKIGYYDRRVRTREE